MMLKSLKFAKILYRIVYKQNPFCRGYKAYLVSVDLPGLTEEKQNIGEGYL